MKSTGEWSAKCDQLARELEMYEKSCSEFLVDNRSYYCHMIVRHGNELMATLDELGLPFLVASLQGVPRRC